MENRKSFLNLSSVDIIPNLSVRIPTVGEILEDEAVYYNMAASLTASPYQYMVQLDDMGVDYTSITDYELFKLLFLICAHSDTTLLFGNLDLSDAQIYLDEKTKEEVIYSPTTGVVIDELVYNDLADTIREINLFEKVKAKPGNEHTKKYLLDKERRKLKRNRDKKNEPYLEKLVVALVNTSEFPYDYDSCMDLSIYRFNRSYQQVMHKISFDNTMIGIYSGTVDTSKMADKKMLSWIPIG